MAAEKIACLLVISGICTVTDLRERKIKNRWIVLGTAVALLTAAWWGETADIGDGLLMLLVFCGILFPLYLIRAVGAGDVKLLGMTALYIGKEEIGIFLAGMLFAGGILAVVKMLYYKNLRRRMQYFTAYMRQLLLTREAGTYGMPGQKSEVMGMALPVFIGVICWSVWICS